MPEEEDKPAESPTEGEPEKIEDVDEEGKVKKKGVAAILDKFFKRIRGSVDKHALVAAVLNVTFWGFGYFYTGKRRTFGLMMMTSEIIVLIWLYLNPSPKVWTALMDPILIFAAVTFFLALAFDGYVDAKEKEGVGEGGGESED